MAVRPPTWISSSSSSAAGCAPRRAASRSLRRPPACARSFSRRSAPFSCARRSPARSSPTCSRWSRCWMLMRAARAPTGSCRHSCRSCGRSTAHCPCCAGIAPSVRCSVVRDCWRRWHLAARTWTGSRKACTASRAQPEGAEALTTIRRGFHTLKGSGRMVGLTELGDAAWEVEQVMNRWLEEKRPATPELLELPAVAATQFAEWTAKLRAGETPEVDVAIIAGLAQRLKPGVFDIYLKEARTHIATLDAQSARWCANRGTSASEEFTRAAHTLASSSRTAGFEPIAELAAALEQWMPFAGRTVDEADAKLIATAVAKLKEMVAVVQGRQAVVPAGGAVRDLQALAARLQPPRKAKEKRGMRDDIRAELLPVFLEEAQGLLPQVAGAFGDWKANPSDGKLADAVKRGLHTLKGSARMAGAIRLGELTHLMESRIEFGQEAGDLSPALLEDLQSHMDRLSGDLERMRQPRQQSAVAELAPAPSAAAQLAPSLAPAAPVAMLRVNAERLDDLIARSGRMAVARSRVQAEFRQVKQSLGELNESVGRLRTQPREVEIPADSQMQSRRSALDERERDFDPLEFDRYTRLQELTRMMAEGLNDAVSIQQALVKNLGETDAALLHQARLGRELQQDLMRMRA